MVLQNHESGCVWKTPFANSVTYNSKIGIIVMISKETVTSSKYSIAHLIPIIQSCRINYKLNTYPIEYLILSSNKKVQRTAMKHLVFL